MTKIETQLVHLKIPKILLEQIDKYQTEKGLLNRTATILELIRKGMSD